jgi:hypothetical protein
VLFANKTHNRISQSVPVLVSDKTLPCWFESKRQNSNVKFLCASILSPLPLFDAVLNDELTELTQKNGREYWVLLVIFCKTTEPLVQSPENADVQFIVADPLVSTDRYAKPPKSQAAQLVDVEETITNVPPSPQIPPPLLPEQFQNRQFATMRDREERLALNQIATPLLRLHMASEPDANDENVQSDKLTDTLSVRTLSPSVGQLSSRLPEKTAAATETSQGSMRKIVREGTALSKSLRSYPGVSARNGDIREL